ncbi:MAG: MotA/TolQ/ExbB proton channel family protein [Gammaproteobacteria bacterium]|jgi:biopolymer transport protein ExbB|nr:MotA/TolQ/ExbB proton channel family protein [Gammaproteobacteria bacterium]
MDPTQALTAMSFEHFLKQTDAVGLFVFGLLVMMSIVSWYFIILKGAQVVRIRSRAGHVVSAFWKTSPDLAIAHLEQQPDWEPFSKIALDGEFAMQHHDHLPPELAKGTMRRAEFLDRALRAATDREMERLETGLTVLASVGSTAPFVGLFGTVWGIFHALVRIGATGDTSLDQVAGPVGEALIMTALGLAVAVPAVLGYNLLVRNNRVIIAGFHAFAEDLLAYLTTGARVPSSMDHHRANRPKQQKQPA